MKPSAYIKVFLCATLFTPSVWASAPGTTSADILKIGVGARAIGMGEAYVAQADDVSSLYWNPAGLAFMQERQASFMYDQMFKGESFQNASLGIPLENGAIGGSLSYLSYGSIQGYDSNNTPIGNQNAYSAVGTLGAAWLGNLWSAGVNAKGVQESLSDTKATTAAFDIGTQAVYPKSVLGGTVRFGAALKNLGNGLDFIQQRDPLPRELRIGVAGVQMLDKKLNLSLDYALPKADNPTIAGGIEYWIGSHLALRTGYVSNHTEGLGIRAGLGLRLKGLLFDYAYAGQGELGMNHRFEVSFRFGEPRPILTPEERKVMQQAKVALRQGRYEEATLLFNSVMEMEPQYRPASRYIQVSMSRLEGQQRQMFAKQGPAFDPGAVRNLRPANMPEMEDLEDLLNAATPKTAQVPGQPVTSTPPPAAPLEVK